MNKKQFNRVEIWLTASLLAATMLVTSCSQDEIVNGEQLTNGNEISFRVSETRNGSTLRAGIADATTITNFTLSGITDAGDALLDAVVVTRSADGSAWEYAPKAVWPAAGTTVDFYAYSPGNSRNVTSPGFKGSADHTLTYTIPTLPNGQEDFIVAVQERTVTAGTQDPVQLNFKHALSRVLVNARAAASLKGVDVVVKSVTFNNLASTATLTLQQDALTSLGDPAQDISTGIPVNADLFTYATYTEKQIPGGITPAYVTLWTNPRSKANYPIDMRGLNGIKISNDGNTYTALTGDMSALMVIPQQTTWSDESEMEPQDTDNDFWVEVAYTVGGADYTAKKRVRDYWKRTEGSFCFEAGKAYEFNLLIGSGADGGQNTAGAIDVTVNDVAGWYVQNPDGTNGVDVDRKYAVGDLYIYDGNVAIYVADVDDKGLPTSITYLNGIGNAVSALFDLANLCDGEPGILGGSVVDVQRFLESTQSYARLQDIIRQNNRFISMAKGKEVTGFPFLSSISLIWEEDEGGYSRLTILFNTPFNWDYDGYALDGVEGVSLALATSGAELQVKYSGGYTTDPKAIQLGQTGYWMGIWEFFSYEHNSMNLY